MDFSSIFFELKKTFHSRTFASFVTVSTAIHIALLVTIPIEIINPKKTQPEIIDVDLVQSHSRPQQKISTKPFMPLKATGKTDKFKKADNNKTNPQTKNPLLTFDNEATVSLFSDNKKQSKYSSYLSHLRLKIDSTWEYPSFAKENGTEGTLTLYFSIEKNGSLTNLRLTAPSLHSTLNREAERAIQAAAPFNPLPKYFSISRLNVVATFTYQFIED